ncbi:unnamed protein product [Mytilus coruscus]|uniref:Uncharacterized protein n=1 Tax=Mytilus coruscus TaxID=42192 RepID=A0A6J7ZZI1_MYTCO|nr:unnamed protein product [Mytilus coruscus]
MTEPTEPRPLKRTIPPDLQRQVEDIQKKIPRTTGPHDDLDDSKKRLLVVGICLHTIISPVLRNYVVPVVTKLCYSLTKLHKINQQTFGSYLKKYPPTNKELNYEAINSNKDTFKWKRALYDYRVKSPVDLSRLFLQTHMAHSTTFDDSCDSSALLGIIINVDRFQAVIQSDTAKKYKEHDVKLDDNTNETHNIPYFEHNISLVSEGAPGSTDPIQWNRFLHKMANELNINCSQDVEKDEARRSYLSSRLKPGQATNLQLPLEGTTFEMFKM